MPPKSQSPKPSLRWHNNAWKIVWRYDGRQYSVSTGLQEDDRIFAEQRLIEVAIALRDSKPSFPSIFRNSSSVMKYINARYGVAARDIPGMAPEHWIEKYEHDIQGKIDKEGVRDAVSILKKLEAQKGGLEKVTAAGAAEYMSEIASARKPATFNRRLTSFKKFYNWLISTGRHDRNPFSGITRLNEGRDTPIVYCTPAERFELIAFAESIKEEWPEWISIPIAFYTGMRRGEIAALQWKYVNFDSGTIFIEKSKTRTSRTFFMHQELEKLLLRTPPENRFGFVVPSDGPNRINRLVGVERKLCKLKRAAILAEYDIVRPAPSKSATHKELRAAYDKAVAERRERIKESLERIGWNAFRHTFASLAVQNGIEIDTVAAWIGDSPEICRRHYAQFIPRDRRDERVNLI